MSDNLIVGDEDCRIRDIANVLKDDRIVFKEWKELGRELEMSGANLERLRMYFILDKLTIYDIILRILEGWKLRNGSNATLVELLGCIDELKWFHISELLSNRFGLPYVSKERIISTNPLPRKLGVQDPVDTFTGRHGELEALHENLTRSSSPHSNTHFTVITQRAAISGLGGIGKTELARQYIYIYGDCFRNILWINAESESNIQETFKSVAKYDLNLSLKDADGGEKDIFTIVNQVYRTLGTGKTLVVFDNAEMIECFKKYLPTTQREQVAPTILLTSRDIEWDLEFEICIISIGDLKMGEAVELVKRGLRLRNNDQMDDIKRLLSLLQCFPLAIQQAIAYIKQKARVDKRYCIAAYIDEFKKSKAEFLKTKMFQGSNSYMQSTYTAWNITMTSVESDKECGTLATRIFYIMAYMAPDNIPQDFFNHLRETVKVQSNWVEALKGIARSFIYMGANTEPAVEQNVTKEKLRLAMRLLVKYSMVKKIDYVSLSIHRLVQEVTRIRLMTMEKENNVLQEALELLSGADEDNLSTQGAAIWKNLSTHNQLVEAYQYIPLKISKALNAAFKYEEAYYYYTDTVEQLNEVLPENNELRLAFLEENGRNIHNIGRAQEGLSILKEVLEKRKHMLDSDHPDNLATMNNMAQVLHSQGKLDEALFIYKEVLGKQEQILGSDHPATLTTMTKMALVLDSQGKLDAAVGNSKEVLDRREHILGCDHPDILTTINNMAHMLDSQGEFDETLSIYREALEKRAHILGSDHPGTLTTMINMTHVLHSQGKLDEALSIYKVVSEKQADILGSDHPDTLTTLNNMTHVLQSQGKLDEALSIYKEVLEKREQILGSDHPDTLSTLNNIAHVLQSQENFDEALSIYKEVLEKREHILGSYHPDALITMNNMAHVIQSQGRFDEALSIYKEVLEKREQILGSDHPDTLTTMINMTHVLHSQGKLDEAMSIYKVVLEKQADILGSDHPGTLTTMNNIAHMLESQGSFDEALSIYKKVLEKREQILGSDNPSTLTTIHNMVGVLESQGSLDEALSIYKKVLEKREHILGSDHPSTLATMNSMAHLLNSKGKLDETHSIYN